MVLSKTEGVGGQSGGLVSFWAAPRLGVVLNKKQEESEPSDRSSTAVEW